MFLKILTFELKYRIRRPVTYIYFGILFLMAFLIISTDAVSIGGVGGQVKINSATTLNMMMMVLSVIFFMITSAIMGVPVLRDFDHKMEALMFVNPIKKFDYLFGRFTGSFIILVLVFTGLLFGFMLGSIMPWLDADNLLPFNLYFFIQPFFIFILSNLFISSAIFFAGGTLSRKILVVYTQGIILLTLYLLTEGLTESLDNKFFAALIDPFALNTTSIYTEYWTIAEKNMQVIPLQGIILYNRLIWTALAFVLLFVTYFAFSFTVIRKPLLKIKNSKVLKNNIKIPVIPMPDLKAKFGTLVYIKQTLSLSFFYVKNVVKEFSFIAIVASGIILLFVNSISFGERAGTGIYPTTPQILAMIRQFELFFLIIIVFFTGELIWKERNIKIDQIHDSLPIPDFVSLIGKFLSLLWIYIGLILLLITTGIIFQVVNGYYIFELEIYFTHLFTETLFFLILYTIIGFFIQLLVNHKFLGFALFIIFFFAINIIQLWGVEHSLFHYGRFGLGKFSDMNRFGHFVRAFSWFNIYWFALSALLFVTAVLLSVRGTDALFKIRLKVARYRVKKSIVVFSMVSFLVFLFSGCYIYYNTNVKNEYLNSKKQEKIQANYEKQLKQYQFLTQPKIIDTKLLIEIYPEKRDFTAEGYFILKNKSDQEIKDIHIQENMDFQVSVEKLVFSRKAVIKEAYDEFNYYIYELAEPLLPGDTIKMDFLVNFHTIGFVEGGSNVDVVYNGTFFNNFYFPVFGYQLDNELADPDDRKDFDLPERERMLPRDHEIGKTINLLGDDADAITLDITIGTSVGQIALAPGYIQNEWEEGNRKYYHYKMDKPIWNFYSIVSADYEVLRDKWKDVNLEIYYHKGHEYNLQSMLKSMKKSLDYYTENFSPYQYKQLRIMEFPRYRSFAQSFANTIPYSEALGFIMKMDEEDDIDFPFYVTAHEIGHQWWAHQVIEANVQGNAMISETLAQYSALMVQKHNYSIEYMQKFLRYELDRYLRGRSSETEKEMPLALVEQQAYIHYRKGSLIMYALQDYISEDSVNSALRRFIADWAYSEGIYPTSADLLEYYREVTPDSLQYIIEDMFETITLFENKTTDIWCTENTEDHNYTVILELESEKIRADSLGNEVEIQLNDWIYIGIYTENTEGKDSLIYYNRHLIKEKENQITIRVNEKPTKAGIDPLNILIDRHPDDNLKDIKEILSDENV